MNKTLLNKGQHYPNLLKLTQGTAVYLDADQQIVLTLTAPAFLNIAEIAYHAPAAKTILAQGKTQVQRVKNKSAHLPVINALKQKSIRKNLFAAFYHT